MKSLQDEGYVISTITNKGYCLSADNDILSAQSISKYLPEDVYPFRIDDEPYPTDVRSRLIAEILKNFWIYYEKLTEKTFSGRKP